MVKTKDTPPTFPNENGNTEPSNESNHNSNPIVNSIESCKPFKNEGLSMDGNDQQDTKDKTRAFGFKVLLMRKGPLYLIQKWILRSRSFIRKTSKRLLHSPIVEFYRYMFKKSPRLLFASLFVSYGLPLLLEKMPWYFSQRLLAKFTRESRNELQHAVLQGKSLVFRNVLVFAGMSIAYAIVNTIEQHLRARVDAECRLILRRMVIERVLYSEMGALQRRYFVAFNEEVRPEVLETRMMQDISDTLNLFNFLIPNIIRGAYAFYMAAKDVMKQDRLDMLLLIRPTAIGILHEVFVQLRQRFISEPQLVALQTTEIAMNRVVGGIIDGLPDVQCSNMQEYQLKKLDRVIAQDVSSSQGFLTATTRVWSAISSRGIFDLISELYVTQYVMKTRGVTHEECRKASLDVTTATNLFRRLYDRLMNAYEILDAQHRVILLLSLPNFLQEADRTNESISHESPSKKCDEDLSGSIVIHNIENIVVGCVTYRHATFVINAAAAAAVNDLATSLIDEEILSSDQAVVSSTANIIIDDTKQHNATVIDSKAEHKRSDPQRIDSERKVELAPGAPNPYVVRPSPIPPPKLTFIPKLIESLSDTLQQSPLHTNTGDDYNESSEIEPPGPYEADRTSQVPTFEDYLNVVYETTNNSNSNPANTATEPKKGNGVANEDFDAKADASKSVSVELSVAPGSNARGIDGARYALDVRGLDDALVCDSVVRQYNPNPEKYSWQTSSRLVLERGKCYALVGQNRSGKTTFVKALCKLISPGEGQKWEDKEDERLANHGELWSDDESDNEAQNEILNINIKTCESTVPRSDDLPFGSEILVNNDIPLSDINRLNWRDFISYIPQRPYLFQGTIEENIRCGNTEATPEEVFQAAIAAGLYYIESDNEESVLNLLHLTRNSASTEEQPDALITGDLGAGSETVISSSERNFNWAASSPTSADQGLVGDNVCEDLSPIESGTSSKLTANYKIHKMTEIEQVGIADLRRMSESFFNQDSSIDSKANQLTETKTLPKAEQPYRPWERNRLLEILNFVSVKITGSSLSDTTTFSKWISSFSVSNRMRDTESKTIASQQAVSINSPQKFLLPALLQVELQPHGSNVSGGTAQSIALARAFLRKKAQLMILDESMSQMDGLKVEYVFPRLLEFTKRNNITLIAVTHHLLPIASKFDMILVMKHGKFVQCGKHSELLSQPESMSSYRSLLGLSNQPFLN